jgi:hypothetical protein
MTKKNHLKFSADGKEVQIVFKDGKESIYYASKKDFAKALEVLVGAQRIAKEEQDPFLKEVAAAEKMPFSDPEEHHTHHTHQRFGVGGLLGLLAFGSIFGGIGIDEAALLALMDDDEPVEVPIFKMCECGTHAKILSREVAALPLFSKDESRVAVELMEKEGYVTAAEKNAVLVQIEASTLPETKNAKEANMASNEAER